MNSLSPTIRKISSIIKNTDKALLKKGSKYGKSLIAIFLGGFSGGILGKKTSNNMEYERRKKLNKREIIRDKKIKGR